MSRFFSRAIHTAIEAWKSMSLKKPLGRRFLGTGLLILTPGPFVLTILFFQRFPQTPFRPLVVLLAISSTYSFLTLGRRTFAPTERELRYRDPRAPILLLRSFTDDHLAVRPRPTLLPSTAGNTLENCLASKLCKYGPVLALGSQDTIFPPLGFARVWSDDDRWQDRFAALVEESKLIVIVADHPLTDSGFLFEMQVLKELTEPEKLLICIPPLQRSTIEARWIAFRQFLGLKARTLEPTTLFLTGSRNEELRQIGRSTAKWSSYQAALQEILEQRKTLLGPWEPGQNLRTAISFTLATLLILVIPGWDILLRVALILLGAPLIAIIAYVSSPWCYPWV